MSDTALPLLRPLQPYFDRTWKLGDIEPAG
jgi:hypothetical protein